MQTFSFSPPIKIVEEGKWFLGVTSFESTNSVFHLANENNSISITIPGHWNSNSAEKTIDDLKNLLEFRSQNDFQLHIEPVRKRGIIFKKDYFLSSFDTFKREILEKLKISNHNYPEDMVCRMNLTYDEIMDLLDIKFFPSKRAGYTLPHRIYEVRDNNSVLGYILPNDVKVSSLLMISD